MNLIVLFNPGGLSPARGREAPRRARTYASVGTCEGAIGSLGADLSGVERGERSGDYERVAAFTKKRTRSAPPTAIRMTAKPASRAGAVG